MATEHIDQAEVDEQDLHKSLRPPILWSSWQDFRLSFKARVASILTRRFFLSLLAGQVVSLCITITNVVTTELVMRGWALPTTQNVLLYTSLCLVFTPYTIYKYGLKGWLELLYREGWKYIILAACDVEGNFLVVKAYQYTDLLSCMLLDAWAIPVCVFFSWVYMRPKLYLSQFFGILICIAGLGLLVSSDFLTDKNYAALDRAKGDAFMIVGATFYGFTNATEEFLVRRKPLYEVVGQLGLWGMIICVIQASALEHTNWNLETTSWNAATVGLWLAYTATLFILYTVAPLLYRMASSTYYNISLLTSDFYGLLFGLFLFGFAPFWLYFPAFAVVLLGLVIYFWQAAPEEQGKVEPKRPEYVLRRTRGGQNTSDGEVAEDTGGESTRKSGSNEAVMAERHSAV